MASRANWPLWVVVSRPRRNTPMQMPWLITAAFLDVRVPSIPSCPRTVVKFPDQCCCHAACSNHWRGLRSHGGRTSSHKPRCRPVCKTRHHLPGVGRRHRRRSHRTKSHLVCKALLPGAALVVVARASNKDGEEPAASTRRRVQWPLRVHFRAGNSQG
jgi:hypothetical protein